MSKASPVNSPTKRTKTNHKEDRKECPPVRPSAAVLETMDRYLETQEEILDSLKTAHQGVGGHRGGKATLKAIQQHVFWESIIKDVAEWRRLAEWRRQCLLKLQTGEVVPLIPEQPVEKKKAGDSSQCCEGFRKMLDPHNPSVLMEFANDYIEMLQYGMKEFVRFKYNESKENRSDAENQLLEKWLSEYELLNFKLNLSDTKALIEILNENQDSTNLQDKPLQDKPLQDKPKPKVTRNLNLMDELILRFVK
jgi:hypothetical protein